MKQLLCHGAALLILLTGTAWAQAVSGSISGTVVDPSRQVVPGATVTLIDEEKKKIRYQLVGQTEADARVGRISYNSPLGRALIGRQKGDEVEVTTPAGERYYEVAKIEFI